MKGASGFPNPNNETLQPDNRTRFTAGDKISGGPQVGWVATSPLPPGSQRVTTGDKISNGPQVGRVAT